MDTLIYFFDFVFHLEKHLNEIAIFPLWMVYAFFFTIIFVETGLVVMPFLPGDSFLFVVGLFVAMNMASGGNADMVTTIVLLSTAAILGDALNYHIGKAIGSRAFNIPDSRWFNKKALIATHNFYERHGGKTIVIARFMPFARTFAPFVAGMGAMSYRRFLIYNVTGGILWVAIFTLAGYYFGQIPWVQQHFSKLTLAIIIASLSPIVVVWWKNRKTRPVA